MKVLLAVSGLILVALVSGCATHTHTVAGPRPLSLAEIQDMSARGVSDETILATLRASPAVYRLTSRDVAALQEARVSPAVIDYLLKTPELYKPEPIYRTYYYPYPPPPYWYWHWGYGFGWHH